MTETTAPETLEFKSELRQILHLITHSLYSHKEIFLRELISNASDAIDKARFASLQDSSLLEGSAEWKIRLAADKEAGTLTVSDNGIGMSREAVIENLGTIARSGTKAFLESLKDADKESRPNLIGQFGVGFYSAFMVADKVTVVSRAAGKADAVRWTSDGQGEFTIEGAERSERGTDVILHLKDDEKEFLDHWRLREVVKQFSDFVEHPVVTTVEKGEGDAKTSEEQTLNSQKALWLKRSSEVKPEEYDAFYKQIAHDMQAPAKVIHFAAEGTLEFKALLYIPKTKSYDLQFGDAKVGPRLYINRVLIMESCEQLLPAYLRFVKGVVDCPDLPLNVSREMLQHNPLLAKIQKSLVTRVLKALGEMREHEYDHYVGVYKELGGILKEGLGRDWTNKEQIADLLLFESLKTEKGKLTTLASYVAAMTDEQKDIYYVTGEERAALEHSPVLEVFRTRGWDVLFLTDPIDEFVMPHLTEYKGKELKPADRNAPEADPEDRKKVEAATESFKPLLEELKQKIGNVKEVRLSSRLKESAAVLVADEDDMGANMQRIMKKLGRAEGMADGPRVLELNPDHPVVTGLLRMYIGNAGDPRIEGYGKLLYEQALIAEGSRLADPTAFVRQLNELLAKDL